ncbi:GIY-YIG nuclease family protein [Thiocystis violascens]|uniref:Putative endonuclease n=1 Tax=Thiocystis violascens (strain ATCC 17096 / DSM 198 / 6111) TaxID=765911 RepID=I3YAK6_THIV6|nr:GIY-YIG nuclease family protein [Thiocystis violascens]AFL74024.1 putative endonuclease [Thiocystis violascens DSM 198]
MPCKKSQADVVQNFQAVHGDRYDYSKVHYKNSGTKVEVVCRVHGSFFILPGHHINGVGCGKCYFESQKLTKSEFVARSRKHFGERYDYSLFDELPPFGEKVEIQCVAHDVVFLQEPRNHQRGHVGCPQCKSLKHALRLVQLEAEFDESHLFEKFCKRARDVHGVKYDYDDFRYVNAATKGKITCPQHGLFLQSPSNHLRGSGCPQCARELLAAGSFKQQCEELGIDYWRALKRRQAGMTEERILSKGYVKSSREVGGLTVHGVSYPNMEEAVRVLNPPASSATIKRWIESGMPAEDAFSRVPNPGYGEGIVYLVTHLISEKKYVGITVQSLERRWEYHVEQAKAGHIKNKKSLHAAIREFGASAFTVDEIDVGNSKGSLEAKERRWIEWLGTLAPDGFNISTGGTSGGSNSRKVDVDGIRFPSVKAATAYIAETRDISMHAAAVRLRKGRIDVKKPARPGESLVKTPAYKAWSRFVHGVINPNSREYIAGVEVCEAWRDFERFLADVGQPPKPGMAFARKDKTKGFVLGNCSWMSKSEASKINAAHMKKHGLLVGRAARVGCGEERTASLETPNH